MSTPFAAVMDPLKRHQYQYILIRTMDDEIVYY
jgi:hypothetical protein